jgi:hypothetical protein
MSPVAMTAVGWAYPNDRGNANLHFFRNGRSLCGKWTTVTAIPRVRPVSHLRDKGWVCEACWSKRRMVAA